MFCPNCGEKIIDNAAFCKKCGAKLDMNDRAQESQKKAEQSPVQSATYQDTPGIQKSEETFKTGGEKSKTEKTNRKSKNKMPLIIGILVLAVIVAALVWREQVDYVETVKQHKPFAVSQGMPYTYEEVLDKYIVSPEWKEYREGDVHYIEISGLLNGLDCNLDVTVKVVPDSDNSDSVLITPETVQAGEEKSANANEAVTFLYDLFCIYEEGYSDLSFLEENKEKIFEESEPMSDEEYYEEYEQDVRKTLLEWFNRHPLKDDVTINYAGKTVEKDDSRYLEYEVLLYGMEYGYLYVNPDNDDMIMYSISDIYGSFITIQETLDDWYLDYYWGCTEENGYYWEALDDNSYVIYDPDGIEILEYNIKHDSYAICNFDSSCRVFVN